jgi:transcriptional regulator with XRE-family HTH domain
MKNKRKLKQFGKFLRQQRDDHRYTIRAFAKKSGITTGTLFRIEEGTAEAGMCALEGIAKGFEDGERCGSADEVLRLSIEKGACMQPGYTIVQLNRVSEKEGKRLIHRTLALVLGVVMAETHTTKGGDPALNLLVLRKNVSESLLGGPDWPLAFERLHAVKHLDHGDIAAGTETVFWSDLPLELNDEVDFDVFQKYLQNPSDADLAAVQQEQEIARATAGELSSPTSRLESPPSTQDLNSQGGGQSTTSESLTDAEVEESVYGQIAGSWRRRSAGQAGRCNRRAVRRRYRAGY